MRIGLFGLFGCGNTGNDASLEAMLLLLRKELPAAELTCICPDPEAVSAIYGVPAIRSSRPFDGFPGERLPRGAMRLPGRPGEAMAMLAIARRFDVMIVPGTGFLDDFSDGPFGWPFLALRWMLACRLSGTRIIMASIGAGPVSNPVSLRFLKTTAATASARSYRDTGSRAFLKRIGIDSDGDPVYPDLAFRLAVPASKGSARDRLTVGVGVMSYFGWKKGAPNGKAIFEAYLAKIGGFIAWLVAEGCDVRLVTGDACDWSAVEAVTAWLRRMRPEVDTDRIAAAPSATLHELMEQLAATDVVVASRYHNIVAALRLSKPVLSLGYAPKNDLLLDEMGLSRFCQHIETFDPERLKRDFLSVCGDRQAWRQRIAAVIADYDLRLVEQDRTLLQAIAAPALMTSPTRRSGAPVPKTPR